MLKRKRGTKAAGLAAVAGIILCSGVILYLIMMPAPDQRLDPSAVIFPDAPPDAPEYKANDETTWPTVNVHDPAILKVDDTYYVYSTDVKAAGTPKPGIMVRKSKDLIHWDWVGYALEGVPQEAAEWTGATVLWAPDVVNINGKFYLYYSASQFGTNLSYIGVAVSNSPEGPWTDQGEVMKTRPGDEPNAIDAQIAVDEHGDLWFVYGSFFGGIYIQELDAATGKLKGDGPGIRIAARDHATEEGAVEGPYIIYNSNHGYYYLFVSYDSLFSDYNVRVARSKSITGPYEDYNGRLMTDTAYRPQAEVGTKILGGYAFSSGTGWANPGHNSVLIDGEDTYLIHHARVADRPRFSHLHVRRILWTEDGWPVVSPERYAGETLQPLPEAMLPGTWEVITILPSHDGTIYAERLDFLSGGKLAEKPGTWRKKGDYGLELHFAEEDGETVRVNGFLMAAWDWEQGAPALVFTGLSDKGIAIWGKHISN